MVNNKLKVVLVIILGLVSIVFYMFFNYSFIEIEVVDYNQDEKLTYKITDEDKTKHRETSGSDNFRKLVSRGSYRVEIKQKENSYFEIANTKNFFQTTEIKASLSSERDREFVGDNPQPCMDYGVNLVSWPCTGRANNGFIHTPATNTVPSTNQNLRVFGYPALYINSVFGVDEQSYIYTQTAFDGGSFNSVIELDTSNGVINQSGSEELDVQQTREYKATDYRGGFLLFSLDGEDLRYYDNELGGSFNQLPSLELDENESFYSLQTYNDLVVAVSGDNTVINELNKPSLFTSNKPTDEGEQEFEDEGIANAKITFIEGENKTILDPGFDVTQLRLCGENLICVLSEAVMTVYSIEGGNLDELYSIPDVVQIESFNENVLLINDVGVLYFDVEERSGYYQYTFDDYVYCGVSVFGEKYGVCVDDGLGSNRSRSVLLINPEEENTDSIDKKIYKLSELEEVKTISIYNNYIHISPEVGELAFDEELGRYTYSESLINRASSSINQHIDKYNIDTDKYNIINTLN